MKEDFILNTLSLRQVLDILRHQDLLKEYIHDGQWQFVAESAPQLSFTNLSVSSQTADADSLFFCKGLNFKVAYLEQALTSGTTTYLAEEPQDVKGAAVAVIVTDINKAMAVLARHFYHFPDNDLTTIGITGTKGKTSTLYFLFSILQRAFPGKVAMTSTEQTTLDGQNYFQSHNSTPEPLDLYKWMAAARDNGMKYFIMEASSQGYKVNRLFGLRFDYGVFLNITPDHISPIEHPTFDDYFYCKRQLLLNAKHLVINHNSDYFPLLLQVGRAYASEVTVFGSQGHDENLTFVPHVMAADFQIKTADEHFTDATGSYKISMPGLFNISNATAALAVAHQLGVNREIIADGLAHTQIAGRMMQMHTPNGGVVIVDFAHNYASVEKVVEYIHQAYPGRKIGMVVGANGMKAFSRRRDFARIIDNYMSYAYLTSDNPNNADPRDIIAEIKSYVTKDVPIVEEVDRKTIIEQAIAETDDQRVLIIVGKGTENYQKTRRGTEPYLGDGPIAEHAIKALQE